jgi:hypothetical protein
LRVFEGRASRTSARAYGLFAELVPELLDALAEAGFPARTTAELSRRLGPLCGRQGASDLAPEERRLDLCDAVAELFSLAAAAGSPVFLLSDADAADRASLELLRYLGAATLAPGARSGGLFVLSYRDEPGLPAPLSDLVAKAPALGLPLTGLDLEGIRAFLSRREVAERLLEATGGLPTALEEVVDAPAARPADLFLPPAAGAGRGRARRPAGPGGPGPAGGRRPRRPAAGALPRRRPGRPRRAPGQARAGALRGGASRRGRAGLRRGPRVEPAGGPGAGLRRGPGRAAPGRRRGARRARRRGRDGRPPLPGRRPQGPRGAGGPPGRRGARRARSAFDEAAELFRRALEGAAEAERPALHQRLSQVLRAAGDYPGALRHVGRPRRAPRPSCAASCAPRPPGSRC